MSQLSIVTTQNVTINFTTASVGHRMLAQLIDYAVKIAYAVALIFIIVKTIQLYYQLLIVLRL